MMPTQSRAARSGGADLGTQRHVAGLFEGPEDTADVLVPLVVESLKRGDRVVHLVEGREGYLERLATELDVSSAVESGQLEIRT